MNKINAVVIRVLTGPVEAYNKYWILVECNSYGVIGTSNLMFSSLEEALKVERGYKFDF